MLPLQDGRKKFLDGFNPKEFRKPQSLEEIIKKESNETRLVIYVMYFMPFVCFHKIEKAIQAYKAQDYQTDFN